MQESRSFRQICALPFSVFKNETKVREQTLKAGVAQGYNEKGDGVELPVRFFFCFFFVFCFYYYYYFFHTLIKYNSKTSNYTTYNTAFTNTSLQYLSNAYQNIMEKKKKIPCTAKYVQF